jgi:hypothetical protein
MGHVYRAKYVKNGRIVALKVLPPGLDVNEKASARFDRELKILMRLRHPNIVRCYGGGTRGTQMFYAMELVTGGSLANLIRQRGKLPWEEAIHYGLQICAALQHAHENGVIHRDLKPSNLLLTDKNEIKLADFGIALDVAATALTAHGKTVGTFTYMSPEQISGNPPVSPKSDLYSLGCVLFKMLTGQAPFEAESAAEILHAHMFKPASRVASSALDCPLWLDALVAQLLEKNPYKRPLDASAAARALREVREKVEAGESFTAHVATRGPTSFTIDDQKVGFVARLLGRKRRRKRPGVPWYERAWFLAACLALLVGVVTWLLWPKSEAVLFAKADLLMKSQEPVDWIRARDQFLLPMQERFPDGEHAVQVQAWLDQIELHITERQFMANTRLGREPKTEVERSFGGAYQYEQFGDRIEALSQYESLITLFRDDPEAKPWVNLARKRIALIKAGGDTEGDRVQVVERQLDRADELAKDGKMLEAREIWRSVISLYGGKRELEAQVRRAEERLDSPTNTSDAEPPRKDGQDSTS